MNRGKLALRAVAAVLVLLALAWFANANGDQAVDVRFGLFTLRRLSLSAVIYGSVILGMLIVLGAGLRSDLRAREALRRGGAARGSSRDDAT